MTSSTSKQPQLANLILPFVGPKPTIRRFSALYELINILMLIGSIYALVNLATVRFVIQGPSMQPNFEQDQFLIVSRVNYLLGKLEYGDIAVFHYPGNPQEDYIKRVIGRPGDVVEIRDTLVYVNEVKIKEPYINEPCIPTQCPNNRWELGENEYFVMGDNRNHSSDSRSFGPVERSFFVGEVLMRYWPPQAWGIVSQVKYQDE